MVTLQFVPYSEIDGMTSIGKINKLLSLTKQNRVVLLQGRLRRDEEAELIRVTMEEINKDFKGIELAFINHNQSDLTGLQKFKADVMSLLMGDREGLTVIGPAGVVKSIKRDPSKIELYTGGRRRK